LISIQSVSCFPLHKFSFRIGLNFTYGDRDVRKKIIIIIAVVLLAFSIIVDVAISDESVEKQNLISLCSNLTKSMMKSPSSYVFDGSSAEIRESTSAEKEDKATETSIGRLADSIKNGQIQYNIANIYIEYEAANSFNALLKNTSLCSYDVLNTKNNNSYSLMKMIVGSDTIMGTDLDMIVGSKDQNIGNVGFIDKIKYFFSNVL